MSLKGNWKDKLNEAVAAAKEETKNALQTICDALNQGQQKKIDLYGVEF